MADSEGRTTTKGASKIPADKINLKLILVSGKTHEFLFSPSDTAAIVTQHVFDNWPEDWADEERHETNILRLIYQGRFLHGNVLLRALQLIPGKTTVMHLVARETLPEPNSNANMKKEKGSRSGNRGSSARGNSAAAPRSSGSACCAGCVIS